MKTVQIALFVALATASALSQINPPAASPSVDVLIQQLGHDEYHVREQASKALEAMGESARSALEGVKNSTDLETRTRARAILARLREASSSTNPSGRDPGDISEPLRPSGQRQQEVKPQRRNTRSLNEELTTALRSENPGKIDELLRELLEESFKEAIFGGTIRPPLKMGEPSSLTMSLPMSMTTSSSTSMRTPEGQLTVSRDVDGKITVDINGKTVESESLKAFKEDHVDIYEKYKDTGVFEGGISAFSFGLGNQVLPPFLDSLNKGRHPLAPQRALGVELADVPSLLRAHLDLPAAAQVIERVTAGSAADRAGLMPQDLLLEVDGQPAASLQDVRRILNVESPKPLLRIKIMRKGRVTELETAWPEAR